MTDLSGSKKKKKSDLRDLRRHNINVAIILNYVKKYDIYIKSKSYKLELLGDLVVYHGIKAWLCRRS